MITLSTTSLAESPIRLARLAVDVQREPGIVDALRNVDAAHIRHRFDLRGQLRGQSVGARPCRCDLI